MILITKIEYTEVDGDVREIFQHKRRPIFRNNHRERVDEKVVREVVRGRRFCRPDGREIAVGLSEQAADVLGLQYEAWRELEQRAENHRNREMNLDWELLAIKKAGFWTRLKWLFTGVQSND